VFAGQRDDPFFGADVGDIFDLLALRKGTGNGAAAGRPGPTPHTIALHPVSQWTLSSHSSASCVGLPPESSEDESSPAEAATALWVQVSRLGNPRSLGRDPIRLE